MAKKKRVKKNSKKLKSNNLIYWRKTANFLTRWAGGFAFISSFNKKKNLIEETPKELTFGQRAADWITKWAGSWYFIIGFFIFLGLWIILNVCFLINYKIGEPWDPYPFILLNLTLSCLAAIQAPVILMSQNRQQERDREKAERDYGVNRRSEREIKKIIGSIKYVESVLREKK